ncbi:transglutaminase-like domain-containing protein [Streptomyces sp. T028]|uniref:transglutaminase-like domain-containing protein n=1 Tax=Streptomyces sp. T028 TaxID=3394379 RepID=UPI003A85D0AA
MSLDFYTAQSAFSDPGDLADRYTDLPRDPARLARITRDVMIHRLEGDLFAHTHPVDRLHNDAETRYIDDILRIVVDRDPAPLTERRTPADRFVGVCRDFALLFCSLLRHTGVPARIRSGFADYFGTDGSDSFRGFHYDHVVTEYWDEERRAWRLADAQLVGGPWTVDFDPMDVPRDRFLVAGRAWRAIRAGTADPRTFGLHPPEEGPLCGERFVAGNVRLDLAALNKVETLLWDIWGADEGDFDQPLPEAVHALYDRAARVTADDEVSFDAARELFAREDGLRTPASVLCLAPYNGPSRVTLR